MEFKSLVLITLVAGFVLVSAENESLEELLRRMLSRMDQTKADADALLQLQKRRAGFAGYTVIRGVVLDKNGRPVSSTDTDFALKLTDSERASIASAFASRHGFESFVANDVAAEGVTYSMMANPENEEVNAIADGKILSMHKVRLGVSVLLMTKKE